MSIAFNSPKDLRKLDPRVQQVIDIEDVHPLLRPASKKG